MASTAVNRPTDIKQKEQDVNQKLQLYGIINAFSNGKVPANGQIDVALNSFLNASFMKNPSEKLSAEGQGLVHDFRNVVEQAKILLLTKNEGNIFQDFIWQTQRLDFADASLPDVPVDKDTTKQHGNQVLEGLRTLGTLIITNGQFRKLLNDATILIRDVVGDTAQRAARKVSPSDEALAQIDQPERDNTWHDAPNFSRDNVKNQLRSAYNQTRSTPGQGARDATGDATEAAHTLGSRDPTDVANVAAQDRRYGTASGIDTQSEIQSGVSTLRSGASTGVPDNTNDRARQAREKTMNYLRQKMPEDRRERTVWRLKKMIVEIQGHPDYTQAINTLLDLAETYVGHGNTMLNQSVGTVQGAHGDNALQAAEADLKELIERFANNTSTNDLWNAINQIYRDADQDPELKNWAKQVNTFIRKCLKEQGYILEDAATDDWAALYDRGNFLLRDRYHNHTDRILDEVKFLADQFDKDPLNRRFAHSCQKLFNDLGNDENGKPTFKPHLVKDLSDVILPAIFENIRYVPIPRIEFTDPMVDVVIENLVVESDNLMPNVVEFASDNYFRWGRKGIANRYKNSIMVSVSGMQMDLRDVSYYVKRKQGFPSITDTGVADVFLGGSGFSFKIKMSTTDESDKHNFFKVDHVDVEVKNFNVKLKQSRHKTLFALFKPVMLKVMRPALQKALEKAIRDKVGQLDQLAYSIKLEADKVLGEGQNDPHNVPNIYNRYVSATQRKLTEGKQKAKAATSDKKANLAITQQESIFPNTKLPGGISSKVTEYRELAAKGDKWESPVFSIGSASPTSDLPSTGKVTRKEHPVNEGGVHGPQNVGNTQSMTQQNRDPQILDSGTTSSNAGNGHPVTNGSTGFGRGAGNTVAAKSPNSISTGNTSQPEVKSNSFVFR